MKHRHCLPGIALLLPTAVGASPLASQAILPDVVETAQPPTRNAGAPTRLLVPLVSGGRILGDLLADLYVDGSIGYERVTLLARLEPLLSVEGQQAFAAALPPGETLTPEDIARAGVVLRYDPSLLEVAVEAIDPQLAVLQRLGAPESVEELPITLEPSGTSAYLNIVGDVGYTETGDRRTAGVLLTGAARHRGLVLEFDGGIDRQIASGSGFYRRYARMVYDEPTKMRRWTAGDVQVGTLGLLGGVFLGGIGVEKSRRVFNEYGPLSSLGGQQVLLERDATVDIFVGGQQVETLQLRAGPYDLAQLRSEYLGRDAQLFITDVTGRRQVAAFDTFLDTGALAEGETEYSGAIGLMPEDFGSQLTYSGDPAFSGFYRRGLSNRLTLGGAVQISDVTQVAGMELVASPRAIPGRFDLGLAVSSADGMGFAGRAGYSLRFGSVEAGRQLSIDAEYRSAEFATVVDPITIGRAQSLLVTANYSQRLSERTALVAGVTWFERDGFRGNRSVFVDVVRTTRRYRLTVGAEFGDDFFSRRIGIRAAISIPLGRSTRGDVSYNSRRDDFRALVSKSYEDRVGSWGYDLGVRRNQGTTGLDLSGTYIGNRFFARGFVTSGGPGFGNIVDNRAVRAQVGTAVAYADGTFAIGRPITDSFVMASPHEDLAGERVALGSSVRAGSPEATSGALGPALSSRLSSYNRQTIAYDLVGGNAGIDIGTGVETVLPPYRSGYRLTVGSGATVTAYGFLNLPSGRAKLQGGTVSSTDDAEFEAQPFFTNSVGRFAVMGLRPGFTYQVRLFGESGAFTIDVPENSESLLQLNEVVIVSEAGKQE